MFGGTSSIEVEPFNGPLFGLSVTSPSTTTDTIEVTSRVSDSLAADIVHLGDDVSLEKVSHELPESRFLDSSILVRPSDLGQAENLV